MRVMPLFPIVNHHHVCTIVYYTIVPLLSVSAVLSRSWQTSERPMSGMFPSLLALPLLIRLIVGIKLIFCALYFPLLPSPSLVASADPVSGFVTKT
jgi:hypothetical protein